MCPDWINTNLGLITLGKIHTRIIQPRIFHPWIFQKSLLDYYPEYSPLDNLLTDYSPPYFSPSDYFPFDFPLPEFSPSDFSSPDYSPPDFFTTGLFTPRLITSRYFTTENVFIKIGVKKSLRKKCCVGGTPLNPPFHKKSPHSESPFMWRASPPNPSPEAPPPGLECFRI